MEYAEFLAAKKVVAKPCGLDVVPPLNPALFPFQRDIVNWALKRGRAAIFAECGMGKTLMQLEWAHHVPGRVLILTPLAVAQQTIREGARFGIDCAYVRQPTTSGKVLVTNYEMLDRFDPSDFAGVVLDESSILKSYMGKTKQLLLSAFSATPYRLACTATPAPNDHMELGNHAEFLGVMDSNEMLSRWFINDAMEAGAYRLKGHGVRDFWRWVASWAVALVRPSDLGDYDDSGFDLPPLKIQTQAVTSPVPDGQLFHLGGTLSATEIHRAKRSSAESRARAVADFVNASPTDQSLVWCDTDYEANALVDAIGDCVEVRGSHSSDSKAEALLSFAEGATRVLITKPKVAGFGMNFQKCHRVAFVGLSYSFESLYQAIRRSWRFGQSNPVEVLIVEAEGESGIRTTVERKMADHERMQREMIGAMSEFQRTDGRELVDAPEPEAATGSGFTLWNGDCVDTMRKHVADNSVDFSVFSPPFSNLYIYTDSLADMGNAVDHSEFFAHFGYLIQEIHRATVPGRLCSVHCKDLPLYKGRDGSAGLFDFPGRIIAEFEKAGWTFHSRVTIWKDPVTEMQRTKNHGLLHKQLCKDSAASRQGMADYLLTFRKWEGAPFTRPVHGPSPDVRFVNYVGGDDAPPASIQRGSKDYSIQVWQRYASPVWFDINQMRVLQGKKNATSAEDERHICPLQLDVIQRAIDLWTNPGDLVLSPFAGIGSEGVVALEMERRFVGVELKRSYWEQAVRNLRSATKQQSLLA